MRITETAVPGIKPFSGTPFEPAQRGQLVQEMRDAIALLQALTEKAQHEVFCRRTLAEMHGEILHARRALAEFERL